jgi:regulatory protein
MRTDILAPLYRYCAYQDRSEREVAEKLAAMEVFGDAAEEIKAHLRAEKFLDEARYARSFVRGKFYHLQWGRVKIRHELRQKGVPDALVAKALAEEIPEDTYIEALLVLGGKKMKELRGDLPRMRRDKTGRFLVQKGYEWEAVVQTLARLEKEEQNS